MAYWAAKIKFLKGNDRIIRSLYSDRDEAMERAEREAALENERIVISDSSDRAFPDVVEFSVSE